MSVSQSGPQRSNVERWRGDQPNALQSGRVDVFIDASQKSGYTLTADSYLVRASSTQFASVNINTSNQAAISISSVTTTRAMVHNLGHKFAAPTGAAPYAYTARTATTITVDRDSGGVQGDMTIYAGVVELL